MLGCAGEQMDNPGGDAEWPGEKLIWMQYIDTSIFQDTVLGIVWLSGSIAGEVRGRESRLFAFYIATRFHLALFIVVCFFYNNH